MKIGIALGSGSARGWAHLGVLQSLAKLGIHPDIVAGASVGSLVGGAYASNHLDALHNWALSLTRRDVWRLLDATFGSKGGFIKGDRLMNAIAQQVPDQPIEQLDKPFASVAADLSNGTEVWIRDGSLHQAIRASSGFPGLFSPVHYQGRWLIDGGVVNPVPVSLCRALGADLVIAVNLNRQLVRQKSLPVSKVAATSQREATVEQTEESEWFHKWTEMINSFTTNRRDEDSGPEEPGMMKVMTATINIMQNRITRSRMVGDPPDATIGPNLSSFQLMDFHRADEAIAEGKQAVQRAMPELEMLLDQT